MRKALLGCLLLTALFAFFAVTPSDVRSSARPQQHPCDAGCVDTIPRAEFGVYYATLGNSGPNAGSLITINLTTGAGTLVGPMGITGQYGDPGVPAIAIRSTGEIFAVDIGSPSNLYRVDALTGAASLIGSTGLSSPSAMGFDGKNSLFAVDSNGDLYKINHTTGVATFKGSIGVYIKGLDFNPTSGCLWGTDASGNIYTINDITHIATLVGNTGLSPMPSIMFTIAGDLFASSGGGLTPNNLVSIDKTTGVGTVIGSIGFRSVSGMATRLDWIVSAAPDAYRVSLEQNYPNPFNPATSIAFSIEDPQEVSLAVHDVTGRLVAVLADRSFLAGKHTVRWDGRDDLGNQVATGVYFFRLTAGQRTLTRKAVLLK